MTAPLRETRIRPNVLVYTLGGESISTSFGANAVAVLGEEAVLLVDPFIAPAHARLLAAAVREKTAAPIRLVVLTHHHTDHALGAAHFAARGATVLAHARCRERMAAEHPGLVESRRRDPSLAALFADAACLSPAVAFEGDLSLDVGGVAVRVRPAGHAHTPGDVFLELPEEGVVVTGDLVSSGYHVNYEDASLPGWRAALGALSSLGATTYIPGHGAAGGPGIVDAQLRYHDAALSIVRANLDPGGGVAALRARFPDYLLEMLLPDTVARLGRPARG